MNYEVFFNRLRGHGALGVTKFTQVQVDVAAREHVVQRRPHPRGVAVVGYVVVKDSNGTPRKLAVIA